MEYEGISVALMERLDERFIPTVCAFANTDGGTVYLGVSGMWEVNGVRDPEQTGQEALSLIREKIIPDISGLVRYEVLDETENGGKIVMAVRIPRAFLFQRVKIHAAPSLQDSSVLFRDCRRSRT